ncbi:hypothetical protein DFJ73DRAFT_173925 [Zopfochytrium polystomum]|nr:hypothetical protein DFJ73DRAFT_173925 [Zopfochytrium polystomum]
MSMSSACLGLSVCLTVCLYRRLSFSYTPHTASKCVYTGRHWYYCFRRATTACPRSWGGARMSVHRRRRRSDYFQLSWIMERATRSAWFPKLHRTENWQPQNDSPFRCHHLSPPFATNKFPLQRSSVLGYLGTGPRPRKKVG